MVGAGVFSLPARFGVATGILGSLIAWAIAGTGMLMLAFVFQNLALRKPDLDSGVFIYAKAGFGDYAGFNSAIGFWASTVAGNAFYWVFITATLGAFFDSFGDGDTVLALVLSTRGRLVLPRPHRPRGEGRGGDQPHRHDLQDHPDPGVHRGAPREPRRRRLRRQLDRLRLRRPRLAGRAGAQHDDHHDVRVHRDRGRERLLALRPEARGRRPRHRHGLPQRAVDLLARDALELRRPAPARDRRDPTAVDGRRSSQSVVGDWGEVVHQHRGHRLGARRLPRLDADGGRGDVHPGAQDDLPAFLGPRERARARRSRPSSSPPSPSSPCCC